MLGAFILGLFFVLGQLVLGLVLGLNVKYGLLFAGRGERVRRRIWGVQHLVRVRDRADRVRVRVRLW